MLHTWRVYVRRVAVANHHVSALPSARRLVRLASWVALLACLASAPAAAQGAPIGVASVIVDLRTGATLLSEQPDVLARSILPGSVAKIAAVTAALEAGIITPSSRIVCTRHSTVDGHRLTCTHPDLHRGLSAAEALTHSCNVFVASVTGRLPRAALDRSLHELGLPASSPTASVTASSLGLEGSRVTVRNLIAAVTKVQGASPPPWKRATLEVVRAGLRGAVARGTASAIGTAGIDAAAKTGTVDDGGISRGVVVGVAPSGSPRIGFGLLVSGAAGLDAAALVVPRLQQVQASAPGLVSGAAPDASLDRSLRIGVATRSGTYNIRELRLEDYVAQVIAGEAQAGSESTALDALAIAARTYALANAGRHASEGFDLCDLTHCQVMRPSTRGSIGAAQRTAGRYLVDRGKPADVFYTGSCGGHTERASVAWKGAADRSYLPARHDPACEEEPRWRNELTPSDLLRALHAGGFRGDIVRGVSVVSRTESGRVAWLRVEGVSPPDVSGENLRTLVGRSLGWQYLRSTLFDVSRSGRGFVFTGRGAGHGVGLCVRGSAARARSGASVEAILREYYPGLTIGAIAAGVGTPDAVRPAAPRIVTPVADESSRRSIAALVSSLVREVESLLEAPVPAGLTLTFHPTVESYERSSGQPWFTAAAAQGATVHFVPLNVLRRRGLLERTIRHELVHAATAAALRDAERWLAEGVAEWAERQHAAGSQTALLRSSVSCPTNDEFAGAESAAALRVLYQRAGDCYEREIRRGRSWKSVRAAR